MIGIIGAMDEEVEQLVEVMDRPRPISLTLSHGR